MPTYLYQCDAEAHHEFEEMHSINTSLVGEDCPKCIEEKSSILGKLKRLIAGGSGFILNGGGWAKDNYS